MKKLKYYLGCLILILSLYTEGVAQVAVNADGTAADTKAMLDVNSTDKGLLIPRMTSSQRVAISPTSTQKGLLVYDTQTNSVWQYNGTAWVEVGAAVPPSVWTAQNVTSIYTTNQTVGVNTTSPNPNAILDLTSTNKAFLPPRMTYVEIKAILSPTKGMLVYDTEFNCLRTYDGTKWTCMTTKSKELTDPTGNFTTQTAVGGVFPRSVKTDASGNVYVVGEFNGTATFGSLPSVTSTLGSSDVFILKYNNGSVLQWVQKAGGSAQDYAKSVDVDASGNIYITGFFTGTSTFGLLPSITSVDNFDMFIAKYNSSGAAQFVQQVSGLGSQDGRGIAVDASGNIYLTGGFLNTATFGTASGSTISISSVGSFDIFIAKYDNSGVVQWVNRIGGAGSDTGNDIGLDAGGNVYVVGDFSNTVTFGGLPSITSVGSNDVFIVKYNNSGTAIWLQKGGGITFDSAESISVAADGTVYVAGYFNSAITFGVTTLSNSGSSGSEAFLLSCSNSINSGLFNWAVKAGGAGVDVATGIAVDGNKNVYITGYFEGTSTFGSLPPITSAGGLYDIFIAKYNAVTGVAFINWVEKAGGANTDGSNFDGADDITVDATGNVYVVGHFLPTARFPDQIFPLTNSSGGLKMFLMKYSE